MEQSPDWALIDRYVAGEASPADDSAIREWLELDPSHAELIATLRMRAAAPHWNVDAAWARVSANIDDGASIRRHSTHPLQTARFKWMAAAAVVVAVGSVWQLASRRAEGPAPVASAEREIVVPSGQRRTITLDDGTQVSINGESRIRYATGRGGARDVILEGEAYFIVTHDPSRPFRVHALGRIAEDIGTRFVVRAYSDQPLVSVVVAEGEVAVRHEQDRGEGTHLRAGQIAAIPESGAVTVQTSKDVDRYLAWTRGSLLLDGESLREAVPLIERWYDVKIDVADQALNARAVNGRFQHETAEQAIAAIALALNASYRISGRHVTLSPQSR